MVQFAVAMKAGEWSVFRDGALVATGVSRSAAIEMAEGLAFEAEAAGETVELVVQSYTGELSGRRSGGD